MAETVNLKKEITAFQKRLNEQISDLRKKATYMKEHGFYKEEEYLREKIRTISEIQTKLDWVVDGSFPGNNIKFDF